MFGSHGKIGKTETNTPFTKKRRTGSWGGERGKVLRALGKDGHRRRRRIWRACFGRIPKLLFELHVPDYPRFRRPLGKIPNLPKVGFDRSFGFEAKFNFESSSRFESKFDVDSEFDFDSISISIRNLI